jgi:non-ribosomal peptide synthetase component F
MSASQPLLIGDLFRRNAAVAPRAVAASLGSQQLTHAELDQAGNRLARASPAGDPRGDRVVC